MSPIILAWTLQPMVTARELPALPVDNALQIHGGYRNFAYVTEMTRPVHGMDKQVSCFEPSGRLLWRRALASREWPYGEDSDGNLLIESLQQFTRVNAEMSELGTGDIPERSYRYGDRQLRHCGTCLTIHHKWQATGFIKGLGSFDAFGLDPGTGNVLVLREKKSAVVAWLYDEHGAVISTWRIGSPSDSWRLAFPDCSIVFDSAGHAFVRLYVRQLGKRKWDKPGVETWISALDMHTRAISLVVRLSEDAANLGLGTSSPPAHNQLAFVKPDYFLALDNGKVRVWKLAFRSRRSKMQPHAP